MLDAASSACNGDGVRWEQLFSDLDARFDDLADAEMMAELPDRQRRAARAVTTVQRLLGAIGCAVRVRVRSGRLHTGDLTAVGPDWLLVADAGGGERLLNLHAVTAIEGLTTGTGAPLSSVAGRLDLRMALGGIARDRSPVVVGIPGESEGSHASGVELTGTIDRVGADFLELAQHPVWEPRRRGAVRSVVLIPVAAVDSVRTLVQA